MTAAAAGTKCAAAAHALVAQWRAASVEAGEEPSFGMTGPRSGPEGSAPTSAPQVFAPAVSDHPTFPPAPAPSSAGARATPSSHVNLAAGRSRSMGSPAPDLPMAAAATLIQPANRSMPPARVRHLFKQLDTNSDLSLTLEEARVTRTLRQRPLFCRHPFPCDPSSTR